MSDQTQGSCFLLLGTAVGPSPNGKNKVFLHFPIRQSWDNSGSQTQWAFWRNFIEKYSNISTSLYTLVELQRFIRDDTCIISWSFQDTLTIQHLVLYESMSKFVKILVRFISYENRWCDHDFFFFTQYYWSYLIRLADKTEKYWCVNIFFIGLKPHFLAFLPVQQKKLNFQQELSKKMLFSQEL